MKKKLTSVEICAGAGGQALGLEQAGFDHSAVVEIDDHAVATLRANRPEWNVIHQDVLEFDISPYIKDLDLFAGGVPCPPFSIAGKQLGQDDERDLFPRAIELIAEAHPKAVMLENVRGLAQPRFEAYRSQLVNQLADLGYQSHWELITAADYAVPQLRPRFILVAFKDEYSEYFAWPEPVGTRTTVGEALEPLMAENGWPGAKAWAKLGVRGTSIAEEPPAADFPTDLQEELPRLTVKMGAVIQGFPSEWKWEGGKTAAWKQVGDAFPPVAQAIGTRIATALRKEPLAQLAPATPIIPDLPLLEEIAS